LSFLSVSGIKNIREGAPYRALAVKSKSRLARLKIATNPVSRFELSGHGRELGRGAAESFVLMSRQLTAPRGSENMISIRMRKNRDRVSRASLKFVIEMP
jgi:hypothetical protein